jgi:hypothetical protein
MRRASTSHATAVDVFIKARSRIIATILPTSSSVLAEISRVEIRLHHKFSMGTKQAVWELLHNERYAQFQYHCMLLTASAKSPAASEKAEMTLGVIILLEGSLILFSSTSIGSSVVVSALRRLTSSM